MANYSQWHTQRAPTSKKVNSIEEISTLSEKVDALMKLVASKNAPIDLNDVPLYTLIEQNSDPIDVTFVSQNNYNNNAYRGNFNIGLFLEIPLIIMVILMVILLTIIIGTPLILRVILNNLSMLNFFNTKIEQKLNKIDDMSRSIDRISHDVENLKIKFFPT